MDLGEPPGPKSSCYVGPLLDKSASTLGIRVDDTINGREESAARIDAEEYNVVPCNGSAPVNRSSLAPPPLPTGNRPYGIATATDRPSTAAPSRSLSGGSLTKVNASRPTTTGRPPKLKSSTTTSTNVATATVGSEANQTPFTVAIILDAAILTDTAMIRCDRGTNFVGGKSEFDAVLKEVDQKR